MTSAPSAIPAALCLVDMQFPRAEYRTAISALLFPQLLIKKNYWGASLVAQWWGICLPIQETQVRSLVWEDPTCCRAAKPVHHNSGAWEPQLLKSMRSIACAPKQGRSLQWAAGALHLETGPCSSQLEKSPSSDEDQAQSKNKIKKLKGIIEMWLAES